MADNNLADNNLTESVTTTPPASPASALSPTALQVSRQMPGAPSSPFTEMIMARTAARLAAAPGAGNGPSGYSSGSVTDRTKGLLAGGSNPGTAPHRPPGSFFPGSGLYAPPGFAPGAGYPPSPSAGTAPADGPYLLSAADSRLPDGIVYHAIVTSATAPTDLARIWIDTSGASPVPRYYDGSAWQTLIGAAGATGATGAGASSQIYAGSGAPGSGLGATGDFYLNTATSDFYQKGGTGWGSPIASFRGTAGAAGTPGLAGADGTAIYNGAALPGSGTPGAAGDYYLDTTTNGLYQKQGGSWVLLVTLAGPAGATGPVGPRGPAGGAIAVGLLPHHLTWPSSPASFSLSVDISAFGSFADLNVTPVLRGNNRKAVISPDYNLWTETAFGWTVYIPTDFYSYGGTMDDLLTGTLYGNWAGSSSSGLVGTWTGPTLIN